MTIRRTFAAALLFSTAAVASTAYAETIGWDPADWEQAGTDLTPADGWHFGKLDNGMRYIVRRNDRPEGTALVRMLVHAAALDEREEERGYAHFIEHMAFNGSTNVPEGEMVKLLERLGLAFGADTNASTGFDYTQYKLDLPRAEEDLLDTALMLMRETASELTIAQEAVERERGVILSERRVRNTYQLQNIEDSLAFSYPGGRVSERLPIGVLATLEAASAASLRAFWEREYVPASTVLVVVGDFDPATVKAKIEARFGDWRPAASPEQPPAGPVDTALADAYDIYLHPALDETVSLARHAPHVEETDSTDKRARAMLRALGDRIVDRRLQRLARSEDPPFRAARLSFGSLLDIARTTELTIVTEDGGWKRGLDAALDEYRRAMAFGVSEAEVAEQVANQLNALETAAAQEATRGNAAWTGAALALAQGEAVPDAADDQLARFRALIPSITPEAVLAALREDWPMLDRPIVRFTGKNAPEGGEAALRSAVTTAFARTPDPSKDAGVTQFAYTDFGTPGTVVADTTTEALGIQTLRFANGVMLNLKPTDLEDDRIRLELTVDGGGLLDTRENPLGTELTGLIAAGGLGRHSLDELQTILAGRTVGAQIAKGADSFSGTATTTERDLELQLQLLAAFLVDPGYRAEGLGTWRQGLPAFFARLGKTPSSAYAEASGAIVSDNDPRFSRQPLEAYQALDFELLRTTISDRLVNGALEIGIVGDFDKAEVIDVVARTFGALPRREAEFRPYDQGERARTFTANRTVHTITHAGEKDQALLRFVWPTADDSDWERSSRLSLLARVARLMLTDTLREELGKTYGVEVGASQSDVWDNYGTFAMGAQVDAGDIAATREALLGVLAKLRSEPIDADLLQRARQPVLESFDNRLKSNAGWLSYVDRAQSRPDDIERFLTAKDRYLAITPEQLLETAQAYLDPAQAVEFRVVPEDR
ncbi:insulinase family protein [Qipengyuania sp. 6B39]|uniref:M16 family metallopeptidase n=1 Tax=Qipengyuania proteolytica TaxID=2867239 RepID=UPI001C8A45D7|nr:insulinase family protein [Qipengyuania proteolytica]MBX7495534.1 insulinase family protein [Qipengyuania proteolytica]